MPIEWREARDVPAAQDRAYRTQGIVRTRSVTRLPTRASDLVEPSANVRRIRTRGRPADDRSLPDLAALARLLREDADGFPLTTIVLAEPGAITGQRNFLREAGRALHSEDVVWIIANAPHAGDVDSRHLLLDPVNDQVFQSVLVADILFVGEPNAPRLQLLSRSWHGRVRSLVVSNVRLRAFAEQKFGVPCLSMQ